MEKLLWESREEFKLLFQFCSRSNSISETEFEVFKNTNFGSMEMDNYWNPLGKKNSVLGVELDSKHTINLYI